MAETAQDVKLPDIFKDHLEEEKEFCLGLMKLAGTWVDKAGETLNPTYLVCKEELMDAIREYVEK